MEDLDNSGATVVQTDAPEQLVGQTLGKYQLKRHLATGGMAEIFLAEQVGPEGFSKEIVIKRILPHLARDAAFTAMFLDEARIAANLNHPNIGQIHELNASDGEYFIAMEFIDGASLDEVIASDVAIPHDVAARIVVDVLQALDFAHESRGKDGQSLGIVHRDVTPSNIMVSQDGIVKLVDFGVAKAAEKGHKTQTGTVKGKFAYMAPEQIESTDVDRRADVFAAGIVLFELLTRRRPFGDDLAAVSRILHEEAPDAREMDASVPESFARVVQRALQKEIDARYPTAETMRLDLETALRQQNSYAGTREISTIVRTLRGDNTPLQPRPVDTGVFAEDRSAEISRDEIALLDTVAPLPVEPAEVEDVAPARVAPKKEKPAVRVPRRLIAGLIAAVVLVALVAGAIGAQLAGREKPSPLVTADPRSTVLNVDPLTIEGFEPAELYQDGGELVVIDALPPAQIFKGTKLVAWTPHQTRLTPGKHRIEFVIGEERRRVDLDVKASVVNRFDLDLSADAADEEPAPRRRRSVRSRLRSLL